ncbi:hypothetical protein CG747_28945 [Streptomyces sp. CB02959]|nr:hypothetical protein CG747_28945 [Streptomyces sp. CB02959]
MPNLATYTIDPPLSVDVDFPGIPIPRLLGLFTWPKYGTEPTSGDTDPDDSSLLVMLPADSPLAGLDGVSSALKTVQETAVPIISLLSGPLGATTFAPFVPPAGIVQQLSALIAGVEKMTTRMSVASHGDYKAAMLIPASANLNSPTRGGIDDLNGIWWDKETGGLDHDYYHDHAKSLLWIAPPKANVVIYRDSHFEWDKGDVDQHGRLTMTTGDTCLVGIPEFRPNPADLDPVLSPSIPGLRPANTHLDGYFTNEHPPTSNDDKAWTDSVEFL